MNFTWKGDYFETDLEFGTLRISGNEEHGFRPYQLMVSSIAVCSTSVLREILEKQRMKIEDIQAHAEVSRDAGQANRISAIALHYKIKGEGLSEKKLDKAVVLAAKNCAMAQTVKGAVDLTETYEIIS